ncbi:MAG: ribosome-associated translation inhibitor RaiA [Methanobacteriota archaeon]|nr:MAG: ribosome-associated translation inhibitor RaiA [Euryarchaeota archaeon]
MDLVLKGRGVRITDQIRRTAEHKLGKLSRLDPKVTRLEVEVTKEPNPRIDGGHRVEVACTTPRRVFRAEAAGEDVATALDQVLKRLERQILSYRGKLRRRRQSHGLESLP